MLSFKKKSAGSPVPGPAAPAGKKDVKQRWIIVVSVIAVGVVVLGSLNSSNKPKATAKPKAEAAVDVSPKGANKAAFEANYQTEIEAAKQKADQAQEGMLALRKELDALKQNRTGGSISPLPPGTAGGLVQPPLPDSLPPPPAPPVRSMPAPSSNGPSELLPPVMDSKPAEPTIFDAPKLSSSAVDGAPVEAVKAKVKYVKNPNAGLLPQGAFVSVETLNGIDAGMGTQSRSDPLPILLNIKDFATLPGLAKYDLRNCFALGSGYGDASSERVYARFSRISCVDKSERQVLTQEISAVLVDADGVVGMRGKVVDRQGAKLAAATAAGVAQGLSSALGQSQGTVTSSLLGDQTSLSGSAALRSSGLRGVESAANQLTQWYLKEANSIFPVITLTANRKGSLLFTENATMVWSSADAQFQKEVKPE